MGFNLRSATCALKPRGCTLRGAINLVRNLWGAIYAAQSTRRAIVSKPWRPSRRGPIIAARLLRPSHEGTRHKSPTILGPATWAQADTASTDLGGRNHTMWAYVMKVYSIRGLDGHRPRRFGGGYSGNMEPTPCDAHAMRAQEVPPVPTFSAGILAYYYHSSDNLSVRALFRGSGPVGRPAAPGPFHFNGSIRVCHLQLLCQFGPCWMRWPRQTLREQLTIAFQRARLL